MSMFMILYSFPVTGICLHGQSRRRSESGLLNRTRRQATETHGFGSQGTVKVINVQRNVECNVHVQLKVVSIYYRNLRGNYLQILSTGLSLQLIMIID